jgi:hypothetical protein
MPDMDNGDTGGRAGGRMGSASAPGATGPRRHGTGSGGGLAARKPMADAVGKALAAHYADLVNAPLPEPLLALLAKLDAADRQKGGETAQDQPSTEADPNSPSQASSSSTGPSTSTEVKRD